MSLLFYFYKFSKRKCCKPFITFPVKLKGSSVCHAITEDRGSETSWIPPPVLPKNANLKSFFCRFVRHQFSVRALKRKGMMACLKQKKNVNNIKLHNLVNYHIAYKCIELFQFLSRFATSNLHKPVVTLEECTDWQLNLGI